MFTPRTLLIALFVSISFCSFAGNGKPGNKDNNIAAEASSTKTGLSYAIHLDNTINKNNAVDSVMIILDKFDHTGAGIVAKVFYPNADNQVTIENLPAGKYYAEIYVLGVYKKHFSTIIYTEKNTKKNKVSLTLDYSDVYTPGNVNIPAENTKMFTYTR